MGDFGRFSPFLKRTPPKVGMTRQNLLCFSSVKDAIYCAICVKMGKNADFACFQPFVTSHISKPKHEFLIKIAFSNFVFLISSIVKRFLFFERQIERTKFLKIFWEKSKSWVAGNIEKIREIYIFLGVVWYSIFFVLTRDVFYVFWGGRHAQGVKSSLNCHLRGQNGGKPLKIAVFARFGPFLEVFSTFLKNGSNDFY